jgi:uncharacterized protein
MVTKIFVNRMVKDLNKSKEFFTRLGFILNPNFTDETAACMGLGVNIYSMLLTENKFKEFTRKQICDAHQYTETLISIVLDSRDKVDEMLDKAIASGGAIYRNTDDQGWMYQCSFEDLDGHQWELIYMNEEEMEKTVHHNVTSQ